LGRRLAGLFETNAVAVAGELEAAAANQDCINHVIKSSGYEDGHRDAFAGLKDQIANGGLVAKVDLKRIAENHPELAKAIEGIEGTEVSNRFADLWNDNSQGRGARLANNRMGPAESASGSGADKMIREYSPDADRDQNLLVMAYSAMARELAQMNTRVSAAEDAMENTAKAVSSIAALLNSVLKGERFPQETETKDRGEEEDERKDRDSDEADLTEKGMRIRNVMGGVKGLMQELAGRASKSNGLHGIQVPPDFSLAKAGGFDELADDPTDSHEEGMRKLILRSRRAAARAGAIPANHWSLSNPGNTAGGGASDAIAKTQFARADLWAKTGM
jgi:hypothetical protein